MVAAIAIAGGGHLSENAPVAVPIRGEIPIHRSHMTFDDFYNSLTASQPPAELTPALSGLWWDAKGDWKQAHERAQEDEGPEASWVHAYLHRKEGDQENAAYWYRRAGKPVCRESFDGEWRRIVDDLVA
jgi:hypothetical protein